jgi:hypothetical protein
LSIQAEFGSAGSAEVVTTVLAQSDQLPAASRARTPTRYEVDSDRPSRVVLNPVTIPSICPFRETW